MFNKYKCRICSLELTEKLVHLIDMPLTDDFIHQDDLSRSEFRKDIEIYYCGECGVVQNPADFNYGDYYSNYQYTSGHSLFVKNFMYAYAEAAYSAYKAINGTEPTSVIEVGSGDGVQLLQFKKFGVDELLGIEPSEYLAKLAEENGVPTKISLFNKELVKQIHGKYDICISSYTFDHVREPIDYIEAAGRVLNENGILAFEVHDFDKIYSRAEYCLLEHEHTIYLNQEVATQLIASRGFEVVSCNPIKEEFTRANSLLILARKVDNSSCAHFKLSPVKNINPNYANLDLKIKNVIRALDIWIEKLPVSQRLVGYGAGGRGVMTLAAINNHHKFSCIFDANHGGHGFLTPKTRLPVYGMDKLKNYTDAKVIVFSFGYFDEIRDLLTNSGYSVENILSLVNFYDSENQL